VLQHASAEQFDAAIGRANSWLLNAQPKNVLDSAAMVWGLADLGIPEASASIAQRLETIRSGQSASGGWGPYVLAPPEPFDTAIVLLALDRLPPDDERNRMIAAGRDYLAATQRPEGNWPATTRPTGLESYPYMISTTAWAALALLATEPIVDSTGDAAKERTRSPAPESRSGSP
jgi:hypothetical protein